MMKPSSMKVLALLQERYPALAGCMPAVQAAAEAIAASYRGGHKLLCCGNGGSAADSLHIVGELMKAFVLPRRLDAATRSAIAGASPEHADYLCEHLQGALPAIALVGEVGLTTAYSNDVAPDLMFAQQVLGYGNAGDVLLGISTSGNSANILYAFDVAKAKGMTTIGLGGMGGGKLKSAADIAIIAPADTTFATQEYHLPIYHALCLAVEEEFFGE